MQPLDSTDTCPLDDAAWVRHLVYELGGDEHEADDVVQDMWLALLSKPARPCRNERGWFRRLARNTILKRRRGEQRRRRREERSAKHESTLNGPAHVDRASFLEWIRRQVETLREPYRSTILERYFKDRTTEAIARDLGVPVDTVRTRLRRAREQLRSRLEHGVGREWPVIVLPLLWPGRFAPTAKLVAPWPALAAVLAVVAGGGLWWAATRETPPPSLPLHNASPTARKEASPEAMTQPAATVEDTVRPVASVDTAAQPPTARRVASPAPAHRRFRGRVEDTLGNPLVNARVAVYLPDGQPAVAPNLQGAYCKTTTGEDGTFVADVPDDAMTLLLEARYPGLARVNRIVAERETVVLRLPKPGALSVRVIDAATGQQVAGCGVAIFGKDGYRFARVGFQRNGTRGFEHVNLTLCAGITGLMGQLDFDDLEPGPYYVTIYTPGNPFVRLDRRAAVIRTGTTTVKELVVPRLSEQRLVGRVVDAATNEPISGADVRLRQNALQRGRTDGEGRYHIPAVAGRQFGVIATAPGYLPRTKSIADGAQGELDFRLVRPARVTGRVEDETGRPVAGAHVATSLLDVSRANRSDYVETDATGRFSIDTVEPGTPVRLFAKAPGWCATASAPVALAADEALDDVVIRLARGATIEGRISLPDAFVPSRGVIALQSPEGETVTYAPAEAVTPVPIDRTGRFRLSDVPAGTYRFTAWIDRTYVAFDRIVHVTPGSSKHVTLALPAERDIAGVVTENREPVVEARVSVEGSSAFAFTDRQGRFRLRGLAPRVDHRLTVTHESFEPLAVTARTGRDLHLLLSPKRPLSGRVIIGETGKPPALFWVRAYPAGRRDTSVAHQRFFSASSGRFRLNAVTDAWLQDETLPDGPLDLEAGTLDGLVSPVVKNVRLPRSGGSAPELVLTLSRGGSLRGVVLNAKRRPARFARIELAAPAASEHDWVLRERTTRRGRFHLKGIRPGRYRLRTQLDGATAERTVTIVRGQECRVRLALPPVPRSE